MENNTDNMSAVSCQGTTLRFDNMVRNENHSDDL